MKVFITTIAILSIISGAYSQDKYKSEDYNFEIEFPDFFEEKEEDRESMLTLSLSSTYKNMILLLSVFEYKEKIPADEHNLKEIESLVITADAFRSKFKVKKLETFKVGVHEGYRNPIKGKIAPANGKKIHYYGCMYVLVIGEGTEFRFTILSQTKKTYIKEIEQAFIESFVIK